MSGENWTRKTWYAEFVTNRYAEVSAGDDAILRADLANPEDVANVTLAAAAPELYEALAEASEYFDDHADAETLPEQGDVGNEEMRLLGVCEKALRKARGEQT